LGAASDIGRARETDEDAVVVCDVVSFFESVRRRRLLIVVADGMGGAARGEIASRLAGTTVTSELAPLLLEPEPADIASRISQAIQKANATVLEYATTHPAAEGMGTTLTCALLDRDHLLVGHVGDSRAYLLDQEGIYQITRDHSHVQEMVDAGALSPAMARTHPRRNVITRVVGYFGEVTPDIYEATLGPDDRILVCCDGLIAHLEDAEIHHEVVQAASLQAACDRLVSIANERGGTDNVSLVLASARTTAGLS
jgi:protein phosphatase